jgi:hypothetical protein
MDVTSYMDLIDYDQLIDDTDEIIHDQIMYAVQKEKRDLTGRLESFRHEKVPQIKGIIESLQCALCMSVAVQPQFVKHCLHFFCRECIYQQVCRK